MKSKLDNFTLVKVDNDDIIDGHFDCPEKIKIIGDGAFKKCSFLKTITLPQGLTQIEFKAFKGCTNLSTITLPQGITEIGIHAFEGCTNLKTITLPQGITKIGNGAFANCTNLETITLQQGVTQIEYNAFAHCINLNTITLPQGVTKIASNAFTHCFNLNIITLPKGVIKIEDKAFRFCCNLKTIIIDSEEDSEINRIRSLLPEELQQNVVKKSSCITWLLNAKKALNGTELFPEICNMITQQSIISGLNFFKGKSESLAETEIKQDESYASDENAIFSPETSDESTNQGCIIF